MLKIWTGGAAAVVLAVLPCAHAQDAVQWRIEDGGNGHWYVHQIDSRPTGGWLECAVRSESLGGYLATFSSHEEWSFVSDLLKINPNFVIAYLGGTQGPECEAGCSPSSSWIWVDGSAWTNQDWYPWYPGEPNGCNNCGQPGRLQSFNGGNSWDDTTNGNRGTGLQAFVIEWSADCNNDDIVDYGQILDGTFADDNGNGVPDCCEGACPGDLNGDDSVGPPDLGILLAVWGTDGGKIAGADMNEDGTVNAADLGLLVGAWGDCGCD